MTQESLQGINIFLIGMMGAGKTTVGQVLAQRLGYRFFDTDVLLERVAGKSIDQIFATEGENAFRELETQVLQELAAQTKSVIATGGGMVLRAQNWSYLHHGLIVWLDASLELLVERLQNDTTRPLLKTEDLDAKITHLLEQRQPLYAQADLRVIIASDRSPDDIVTQLMTQIPSVIKPKPILTVE